MNYPARILLLAVVLGVPALSVGADKPKDPHAKPSSYAPRPSNGSHVYGAPLAAPLVGPARPDSVVSADNKPQARAARHDKKAIGRGDRSRKSASQQPKRNVSET